METVRKKASILVTVAVLLFTMCLAAPVEALSQGLEKTNGTELRTAARVTDVSAQPLAYNKIQIRWVDWDGDNDGFEIYRASKKNGTYERVKVISDWMQDTWNDTKVKVGTRYYYKIRGFSLDEEEILDEEGTLIGYNTVKNYSSFSSIVSAVTKLSKPSLTAKAAGATKVKLSWKKVNGASGYKIYKYNTKKKKYTVVKTIKTSSTKSWTNKKLKTGKKVKYKMRAYKTVNGKAVYSAYSKTKSATPKAKKKKSSGGTVYITKTGTKYHRGSCRYLRQSKIKISRSQAIAQGYKACKVCKP